MRSTLAFWHICLIITCTGLRVVVQTTGTVDRHSIAGDAMEKLLTAAEREISIGTALTVMGWIAMLVTWRRYFSTRTTALIFGRLIISIEFTSAIARMYEAGIVAHLMVVIVVQAVGTRLQGMISVMARREELLASVSVQTVRSALAVE